VNEHYQDIVTIFPPEKSPVGPRGTPTYRRSIPQFPTSPEATHKKCGLSCRAHARSSGESIGACPKKNHL